MLSHILDSPVHAWLTSSKEKVQIVLSSRIRLARNFKDIPFTVRMDEEALRLVDKRMRSVLSELQKTNGQMFGNIGMEQLSQQERAILMEKHLISPKLNDSPHYRSVVVSEDGSIAIMVNEEDHLRMQSMAQGLNLKEAYQKLLPLAEVIEKRYGFAFDEEFGYLTACPTNVGTGLRASVMVHLPALTMTKRIQRIINGIVQLGYTVRGLYGEGSAALGHIYQISNQVTMGITEEKSMEGLERIIEQLVKEELQCRERLLAQDKGYLEDYVYRALGLLTYARRMNGEEALSLLSDVQLGLDLGLLPKLEDFDFNTMVVITRPNFIEKYAGKEGLSLQERDRYRANVIRDVLS